MQESQTDFVEYSNKLKLMEEKPKDGIPEVSSVKANQTEEQNSEVEKLGALSQNIIENENVKSVKVELVQNTPNNTVSNSGLISCSKCL